MKKFIKSLIPPILLSILKKFKKQKYGWVGDYKTWEEAEKDSTGYECSEILEKVRGSLLKVKNGNAVYERDSVIFDEIQYSWPLLAGLMYVSAKFRGVLKVCDFGGSLGSTYFQNKKFLDRLDNVSWSVVEQSHFINMGKKDFEDNRLKFYHTVDECVKNEKSNVLILSSVLQYIEKPYELLDNILKNDFKYIIIDRTPFSKTSEKIKVQVVPPIIYQASYSCRFFDENSFLKYFKIKGYKIIEKFIALDGYSTEYEFKGFIFEKEIDV